MAAATSKPRIFIDARMISPEPHGGGGFGRHVSMIALGLSKIKETRDLGYEPIFLLNSRNTTPVLKEFATCEISSRFLHPAEIFEIPKVLRAAGADAYHSPTFSSLFRAPCPWMMTVHDLNHLSYGGISQKIYYNTLLLNFMKKAQVLLTISEFSKKELANWAKLDPARIEVVYNPIDPSIAMPFPASEIEATLRRFGVSRGSYFFTLSNLKPHKNLKLLTEAFQKYREENSSGWDLVMNVAGFESQTGIKSVGPVSEQESRALILGAGAFVFPSLYEGFGLPPVEAATLGTPVIGSEIPALKEGLVDLKANEIIWARADSREDWAQALEQAASGGLRLISPETRAKILSRFNLTQFGRSMDQIYRRMLGMNS